MQSIDGLVVPETDAADQEREIQLTDDTAQLFRLFEIDILSSLGFVGHRVNNSIYVDKILALGEDVLALIAIYLFESQDDEYFQNNAIVRQAWCIVLSWIAVQQEAEDAPKPTDDFAEWFAWAVERSGLQCVEAPDDEDDDE